MYREIVLLPLAINSSSILMRSILLRSGFPVTLVITYYKENYGAQISVALNLLCGFAIMRRINKLQANGAKAV